MMQIFPRSANVIARLSLISLALLIPILIGMWVLFNQSFANTNQDVIIEQPISFSHEIHAGRLQLDCRYCHTSVQNSAFAGMPSTKQCMTCHSQVVETLPGTEALVSSFETGTPIVWQRVDSLPDFVYFNHSAHVDNGVACETCHGRVDEMSIVYQTQPLTMQWCLGCHRDPANNLRPEADVFTMGWTGNPSVPISGTTLVDAYGIQTQRLTGCYVCHR